MNKNINRLSVLFAGLAVSGAFTSCVDDDYDLTEDIDLTVTVGGDLSIPASSTEPITLAKILDLDNESSIIAAAADNKWGLKQGDYVLVQDGSSDENKIDVPVVELKDIKGSIYDFEVPPFVNVGMPTITVETNSMINDLTVSADDVTTEIVAVDKADMNLDLLISISFKSHNFSGDATIEPGYTAVFDETWSLEPADDATAALISIDPAKRNVMTFVKEAELKPNTDLNLKLRLTEVDLTKLSADRRKDEGLYAPGHFCLKSDIDSKGEITISADGMALGQTADLELTIKVDVPSCELVGFTGIVDPRIDITASSFDINDIPDFLSDPKNHLDVSDPRIYVTVHNGSPLTMNLNGTLEAFSKGAVTATVKIGDNNGTPAVHLKPEAVTTILISSKAINEAGVSNVVVPNLGDLLTTIPDRISFDDITCKALPETVSFKLNGDFTYNTAYEAVIPLAFGPEMSLYYSDDEGGWDLDDIEDYSAKAVELTLDVENGLPLGLTPGLQAIDRFNNVLDNITVDFFNTGTTEKAFIDASSSSSVTAIIRNSDETRLLNLKDLDGVRFEFTARTNAQSVGVNLNENQSLRFINVTAKIKGGVTVDLNDI